MWSKITILGCLILTTIVVHTAVRIEHMNELCGQVLPLNADMTTKSWQVADLKHVLAYVDEQIMLRRMNVFSAEHPDEAIPSSDSFMGAPYSDKEQNLIDRSIVDHENHTRLHWWVRNFGAMQYALAPICFVWAIGNVLAQNRKAMKLTFSACALLSFAAIFLMFMRGY